MNTIAWRDPTTPLPMENNPRMVFERLFGEGGSTAERRAQFRKDRSILDAISDDLARLRREVGAGDRARVTQYLDAVRAIERRIQLSEQSDTELPELARPVGIPDSYPEHVGLMFDLTALAWQADITRVFTFMLGRELNGRAYPEIGIPESHHGNLAPPLRPAEAGPAREDQHLPRHAVPGLPGDAGLDSRRGRLAARPLAAAVMARRSATATSTCITTCR